MTLEKGFAEGILILYLFYKIVKNICTLIAERFTDDRPKPDGWESLGILLGGFFGAILQTVGLLLVIWAVGQLL